MDPNQSVSMPDVAESQTSPFASPLDWVGMEKVEVPILLESGLRVPARADIFVNVMNPQAKGIHMSRLFLALKDGVGNEKVSLSLINKLLHQFIDSQKGLSDQARLRLSWDELSERKALLSEYTGWKSYPVFVEAYLVDGEIFSEVSFSFYYSSTCPCSAALSRQLFQQAFAKEFCDDNLNFQKAFDWLGSQQIASPHSQRSRADVRLIFDRSVKELDIMKYVDSLEATLKTPVQTAVKREDEQEFARLNGENTMFVEDALRKMKGALLNFPELNDFHIKAHHYESLHAHDAVGSISK